MTRAERIFKNGFESSGLPPVAREILDSVGQSVSLVPEEERRGFGFERWVRSSLFEAWAHQYIVEKFSDSDLVVSGPVDTAALYSYLYPDNTVLISPYSGPYSIFKGPGIPDGLIHQGSIVGDPQDIAVRAVLEYTITNLERQEEYLKRKMPWFKAVRGRMEEMTGTRARDVSLVVAVPEYHYSPSIGKKYRKIASIVPVPVSEEQLRQTTKQVIRGSY